MLGARVMVTRKEDTRRQRFVAPKAVHLPRHHHAGITLELKVETVTASAKITIVAEVRHGPFGKWYRSEIDIIEPMTPMDLPNALRQLGDELERNLREGAA